MRLWEKFLLFLMNPIFLGITILIFLLKFKFWGCLIILVISFIIERKCKKDNLPSR